MVDRRALPVHGLVLGPAADQSVEVAGLELVGVGGQRRQVGDAVAAGPSGEGIVEGQGGQHGEAACATSPDGEPLAVDVAPVGEEAGHGDAVVHVEHPPATTQAMPVGPAVARRAPVVDVGHGKAPAGPEGDAELEVGTHTAGRAAVDEHDQWRSLPPCGCVVGVGGRVDEGVGVLPTGGRIADRFGDGQPGRGESEVACGAQDPGSGGRHRHHLGFGGPRGGHGRHAVSPGGQRPDRGGVERNVVDGAVGLQEGESVDTALPAGEPHVVADEGVPGEPEHPLGRGDLELAGRQPDQVVTFEPVQVPPAVPVADHVQGPVSPPLGLEKRLPRRRHAAPSLDRAVAQVGNPELAVVPGQVRVVPLDPRQATAVR